MSRNLRSAHLNWGLLGRRCLRRTRRGTLGNGRRGANRYRRTRRFRQWLPRAGRRRHWNGRGLPRSGGRQRPRRDRDVSMQRTRARSPCRSGGRKRRVHRTARPQRRPQGAERGHWALRLAWHRGAGGLRLDGFRVGLRSGRRLGRGRSRSWMSRRRMRGVGRRTWKRDAGRPKRYLKRRANRARRFGYRGRRRMGIAFGMSRRGFVMSGAFLLMGVAVGGACQSLRGHSRTGETPLQFNSDIFIDRAGMRLFLVHAHFGQQIEYDARLHFKFPRQLVDSDLLHRTDCYITPCTTAICI